MLYDVATPQEYLDQLEEDWRKPVLLELREMIKEAAPHYKEVIYYKMLGYQDEEFSVFALNAQKNYVSLYVGDIKKIDEDGSLLEGLNQGKGCIRFTKTINLTDTSIKAFIERTVAYRAKGKDIDC